MNSVLNSSIFVQKKNPKCSKRFAMSKLLYLVQKKIRTAHKPSALSIVVQFCQEKFKIAHKILSVFELALFSPGIFQGATK